MNTRYFIFTFLLFLSICPQAQNVGIGTNTPHTNAFLHVEIGPNYSKGFIVNGLFSSFGSSVADLNAGSRVLYYPGRSAFRAGTVSGDQWNNLNVGAHSFATGLNTTAKGLYTAAFGHNTTSLFDGAFASGNGSIARGASTVAMGYSVIAAGNHSAAFNYFTTSKGYASTVVGIYNDSLMAVDEFDITPTTPLFIVGNGDFLTRSNAMVVRKNGNIEVENLIIGNGTAISKQQSGTAIVGANGSGYKVFTMNFPQVFAGVPKVMAIAKNEAATDFPDTFVITVRSVSTTSVTFNIQRLDLNAAWAQNLQLDWMAWE